MTLNQIANEVGCSRQRVHQVLQSLKLPTKSSRVALLSFTCIQCGRTFYRRKREVEWRKKHLNQTPKWCNNICQGTWMEKNNKYITRKKKVINDIDDTRAIDFGAYKSVDTGCEYASSCLSCPFPFCKDDNIDEFLKLLPQKTGTL